jgi:hypothetical protein
MVKPPVSELGGPRARRKLKNSEGEALQAMVPHKFTLEACADDAGKNRVFREIPFCSPAQSFLERDVLESMCIATHLSGPGAFLGPHQPGAMRRHPQDLLL